MEIPVTKLISIRKALELLQSSPTKRLLRDRSGLPNAILKNLPKRREVLRCLNGVKLRVHPPDDRGEFQEPPGSTRYLGQHVLALDALHDDSRSSLPLHSLERGGDEWESGADGLEDHHLSVCSIVITGLSVEAEHGVGTPA